MIKIIKILKAGGVGIVPTDTLYGLVGSALNKKTVERVYNLRKRDLKKPMIILISSLNDLKRFGIVLSPLKKKILDEVWPAKVSIVFECKLKKWEHLHRGQKTLAFRFPINKELVSLLKKVGPLVAPSANLAGEKPAETYAETRKYFGEDVDFYVDSGKLKSKPSTLVELGKDGQLKILREGAVKIAKMPKIG
ncbi:MAG TPA: threonylcarbamoyl-AMP synthase [Candidatus Moranbacteria bacterium]|nr:threonylcarbamoyl-AMP synthase [Candidatus Moranbacteria bacterium]HBT46179.1 threonylcarbamoyl-AMP synthase [Candidatus Moranbacteria bacterium]